MHKNSKNLCVALGCAVIIAARAANAVEDGQLRAQAADPVQTLDMRDALLAAEARRDWDTSTDLAAKLVKISPRDGGYWLSVGRASFELEDYDTALEAYDKALRLGFMDAPTGYYQLARISAKTGELEAALGWLSRALDAGYRWKPRIASDEHFANLREDERFRSLLSVSPPADHVGGWLYDLDTLKSEIRRTHFIYRDRSFPRSFETAEQEFRNNIAKWNDTQAYIGLQKVIASLGDGHSLTYPFAMERGAIHAAPIRTYWFEDGLYILDSVVEPDRLIGRRVLRIGKLTPEIVKKRLAAYISVDNEMNLRWVSPAYMTFCGVAPRDWRCR